MFESGNDEALRMHDLVGGPFAVIESDPGVFTTLIHKLGVRGLEVTEIYDIEPWAMDSLAPHGLIFCYLYTDENDPHEDANDDEGFEDRDAQRIWFANQLSDDACASHAILNVLLNCPDIDLGEELREFNAMTEKMSPVMRGLSISNSHLIRQAQNSLARPTDVRGSVHAIAATTLEAHKAKSKAKSIQTPRRKKRKISGITAMTKHRASEATEEKEETYHFIGYVPVHNKVWELDGLRKSALEVGELASGGGGSSDRTAWLDVVRPALKMKMQRYFEGGAGGNDHIQYNLLAIVDDRYQKASDELELLKRERTVLERRLNQVYPEGWADKVDQELLAGASEIFATSIRPSSDGTVFGQDFGFRKLDKEIAIHDLPARNLAGAWEACVRAASSAKVAIEDEATKSMNAHTDHISRTFDYEPFIKQFITSLQNEGLLDTILSGKPSSEASKQPKASAKSKTKRKK